MGHRWLTMAAIVLTAASVVDAQRSASAKASAPQALTRPPGTCRRSTQFQRHLAGAEHGVLEPRELIRRKALNGLLAARRDRRHPGRTERRARRDDSVHARSARQAQREPREVAGGRSRSEVLHARRAARHLSQHAVSDLPGRRRSADGLSVRGRESRHLHERSLGAARRFLDGQVGRDVGRRRAGRHHEMAERTVVARSRRQSCQQSVDRHRALQAARARTTSRTRPRSTTRRRSRARGRSRCRSTG